MAEKSPSPAPSQLIRDILDLELHMFMAVNAANNALCRDDPDAFRLHRSAQFSAWSGQTLASYLEDLKAAASKGENLMTFKYARMEGLIPPKQPKADPVTEKIIAAMKAWQQQMFDRYPLVMSGGRPLEGGEKGTVQTSFTTYLRGEIESYSQRTRDLLYRDILEKQDQKINMAQQIYNHMARALGYSSIKAAEARLKDGQGRP